MYLDNLVFDAVQPQRLGHFWEAVVAGVRLTDEPDAFETRLTIEGGPVLDLCFQRVLELPSEPPRLHLDLLGGGRQGEEVDRLLGLGARHLDIGQRDVPWVVLADPEGNPLCVMEDRASYKNTGPIAALPLDSADPEHDGEFWSWLTGWTDAPGVAPRTLRHPSLLGPLLELCPEPAPRARRRTGCTSISGLRLMTISMESQRASPSGAAASCTATGASCRGGSMPTHRATSYAYCQRGREERSSPLRTQAVAITPVYVPD
jgi:hypothetical protein